MYTPVPEAVDLVAGDLGPSQAKGRSRTVTGRLQDLVAHACVPAELV